MLYMFSIWPQGRRLSWVEEGRSSESCRYDSHSRRGVQNKWSRNRDSPESWTQLGWKTASQISLRLHHASGSWFAHSWQYNNVQFTHQGMAPICRGRINDVDVDVTTDSGSTSCVVCTDLVRETQKTGTTSLCMLIDGILSSITLQRSLNYCRYITIPRWSSTGTMHGRSSAWRHHRKCTSSERPTTELWI